MPRRFPAPGDLLRAYEAHQFTGAHLDRLKREWADEQAALERELKALLAHFPDGVRHHETVLALDRDRDRVTLSPAPADSFDLVDWVDVEERGADGEDREPDMTTIGPGPFVPGYTVSVSAIADVYPDVDGSLALAGIVVRDDDGDDF